MKLHFIAKIEREQRNTIIDGKWNYTRCYIVIIKSVEVLGLKDPKLFQSKDSIYLPKERELKMRYEIIETGKVSYFYFY